MADEKFYVFDSIYQESEAKVTEPIQEIINEKTLDATEDVKSRDNTMWIVPVIIKILAVAEIILLIIRIRRSKT